MKNSMHALLTTTILGLVATARADLTWDWTLTGIDNGSGTLITRPYSANANPDFSAAAFTGPVAGYLVIGATGTFDGDTITGVPNIADAANALWDQLLVPGGFVDAAGLLLADNNSSDPFASFYFSGSGAPTAEVATGELDADAYGVYGGNPGLFTAVLVPSPEPPQFISMLGLAALGGVVLIGRFHRRK